MLPRFLGNVAYYASRCLQSTLRVKTYIEAPLPDEPCVFCFWHGKQFMPIMQLRHPGRQQAALVSPSQDGEILATWLGHYGFKIIRGSSRRKGVVALTKMVRAVQQGYSLGLAPDGPTGPIHQVKPGALFIAQKTGASIVPVGTAFSRHWLVHKAWDLYEIPKPFAKVGLYIGAPISLTQDAAQDAHLLEKAIHQADAKAAQLISKQPLALDYSALSPMSLRKKTPSN